MLHVIVPIVAAFGGIALGALFSMALNQDEHVRRVEAEQTVDELRESLTQLRYCYVAQFKGQQLENAPENVKLKLAA